MNRANWKPWISSYNWPAWTCPTCHSGTLQLDRKSVVERETAKSRRDRNSEDWDPAGIFNNFTAWLKCSKATCGEVALVAGSSGVDPTEGAEGELELEEVYSPRFVMPMPDIIAIPAKCPEAVAAELRSAFRLFWLDTGAAANRLRVALEALLDVPGIRRRQRVPGKIKDLSLHQRIIEYEKREPVVAAHLMAVKWLGNTASHESGVSQDALLDALEIVEHVLDEIIDQRSKRVSELAKKLTDAHAPKRAKKDTSTRKRSSAS
ncbi:MAG TPA: DUF4145 domain-containing protein [Longimicrobium sp.]|nr:DUF4145 domain-containing protein [Longimicrobium sp.]